MHTHALAQTKMWALNTNIRNAGRREMTTCGGGGKPKLAQVTKNKQKAKLPCATPRVLGRSRAPGLTHQSQLAWDLPRTRRERHSCTPIFRECGAVGSPLPACRGSLFRRNQQEMTSELRKVLRSFNS